MNGSLWRTEVFLAKRLHGGLGKDEEFITGCHGRTNLKVLPQLLSFTGHYLALTTDRLLVLDHNRIWGTPAKVRAQFARREIVPGDLQASAERAKFVIRFRHRGEEVFHLFFVGCERRAAEEIASTLAPTAKS